jgi:nucleoside-diphosphate-sugar epimerase
MTARVLVTGGRGFIGAYVVRELLENGAHVLVIDREPEGNTADEVLSTAQRAAAQLVASAIPGVRTLTRLLREHSVEIVVHLASPLATVTEGRPRLTLDQMIAPHVAILEACRLARARKVVWASSVGVFGRVRDYPRLPIPNDAAHQPVTAYGAAKSFLERLSSHYTALYGLDTLGLRFPLVYGPGRRRGGGQFTTELIEGAALGRRCVVNSADATYNWLYVADAARSVLMAIQAGPVVSRALTVCGQVASIREVAQMLRKWFPEADVVERGGTADLVADFDPAPAFDHLGYSPVLTLDQGVLATANAARQRAGLSLVA